GDPAYQITTRKFGYFHQQAWDSSILRNELTKYGGEVVVDQSFPTGASAEAVAGYQESARTIVAKMKAAGVTSVIDGGHVIFNPIVTKEATSQQWFPEWVEIGYGGNDLDLLARLNDPAQWQHAFGLATFPVGCDKPLPEQSFLNWYYGGSTTWNGPDVET